MEDILAILEQAVGFLLPHLPFIGTVLVFTIIGQFTSRRLFTRERAYKKQKSAWYKFWENQWFWWWMRESLPLHPIMSGALLGLVWQDPEGHGWAPLASMSYFALAGVLSLFSWAVIRGVLKKRGIDLVLPGESVRPPRHSYPSLSDEDIEEVL
tara:strand:+ start:189006 stop:189467 length:462 start_codon:yes stop_codon:yes gene_type:complete